MYKRLAVLLFEDLNHSTARVKSVFCAVYCVCAGEHDTTSIHVIPSIAKKKPAGFHSAGTIHAIPPVVDELPAGFHGSIAIHVVPVVF